MRSYWCNQDKHKFCSGYLAWFRSTSPCECECHVKMTLRLAYKQLVEGRI